MMFKLGLALLLVQFITLFRGNPPIKTATWRGVTFTYRNPIPLCLLESHQTTSKKRPNTGAALKKINNKTARFARACEEDLFGLVFVEGFNYQG